MKYLQVKSWEDFQHYKDRTPPWIKLYNHLLDDFEFSCLPDASKAHLLSIWLLASRTNNKIPNNARWIGNKINATEDVDLNLLLESGFIELIPNENNELHKAEQYASKVLQTSEHNACLEREERESRVEGEKSKRFAPPSIEEILSHLTEKGYPYKIEAEKFWNYYESNGWKVGKNKMKNWKSAATGWIQRANLPKQKVETAPTKPYNLDSDLDLL